MKLIHANPAKTAPDSQPRKVRVGFKAALKSHVRVGADFFRNLRTLQRETRALHEENVRLEIFFKKLESQNIQ